MPSPDKTLSLRATFTLPPETTAPILVFVGLTVIVGCVTLNVVSAPRTLSVVPPLTVALWAGTVAVTPCRTSTPVPLFKVTESL